MSCFNCGPCSSIGMRQSGICDEQSRNSFGLSQSSPFPNLINTYSFGFKQIPSFHLIFLAFMVTIMVIKSCGWLRCWRSFVNCSLGFWAWGEIRLDCLGDFRRHPDDWGSNPLLATWVLTHVRGARKSLTYSWHCRVDVTPTTPFEHKSSKAAMR